MTRSIGWGLFLASSWTWCIGAFLPVLLLRNWGWPGFLVFAVPNVIGATAVGFLWSSERSRTFTERRRVLLAWFSAATIAYQAFFIAWMAPLAVEATFGAAVGGEGAGSPGGDAAWTTWLVALALFVVAVGGGRGGDRAWISLGTIATLGSLVLWARHGTGSWGDVGSGSTPRADLALLAPAIALGFLVCPHLDLTFHRVLQRDGTRTPWIVFAPAFTAMLLFAASLYAGTGGSPQPPVAVTGTVAAWWLIQLSFTAAVHARELRASALPWAAALVPISIVVGAVAGRPGGGGEGTYLRLLGLYGALFPPVALLLWKGRSAAAILAVLAVALPAFEWGFPAPGVVERAAGEGLSRAWAPFAAIVLLLGMLAFPAGSKRNAGS